MQLYFWPGRGTCGVQTACFEVILQVAPRTSICRTVVELVIFSFDVAQARGEQIPGDRSLWQLNFLRWCQIFIDS